ncbi:hypothetical protein L9F63_022272, partial [Diploptera punctata]
MANYHKPEARTVQELKDIAHKLRIDSISATNASKSGRSSFKCAHNSSVEVGK